MFAGGNETVLKQGDQKGWKRLIMKVKTVYMLHRERNPLVDRRELIIEISDKRTGVVPIALNDD